MPKCKNCGDSGIVATNGKDCKWPRVHPCFVCLRLTDSSAEDMTARVNAILHASVIVPPKED